MKSSTYISIITPKYINGGNLDVKCQRSERGEWYSYWRCPLIFIVLKSGRYDILLPRPLFGTRPGTKPLLHSSLFQTPSAFTNTLYYYLHMYEYILYNAIYKLENLVFNSCCKCTVHIVIYTYVLLN